MNTVYLTSKELKERSKIQLEGKFGLAIGMVVVVPLVSAVMSFILSSLIPAYTIPTLILQLLGSFIVSVILGVFQVGTSLFSLKIACGQNSSFSDLIFGFQNHLEKSLLLSLVLTSFSFVCQLLTNIPLWATRITGNMFYMFWNIPLGIISIVLLTYLSLLFSQVFFLLLDFPDYSAGEILKLSCRIMNGHKSRLLYIMLSFIPLILLSTLTCGIGLLWLMPYRNTVMANFYLDLMKHPKQ